VGKKEDIGQAETMSVAQCRSEARLKEPRAAKAGSLTHRGYMLTSRVSSTFKGPTRKSEKLRVCGGGPFLENRGKY